MYVCVLSILLHFKFIILHFTFLESVNYFDELVVKFIEWVKNRWSNNGRNIRYQSLF